MTEGTHRISGDPDEQQPASPPQRRPARRPPPPAAPRPGPVEAGALPPGPPPDPPAAGMHQGLPEALADGDARPLRDWLTERGVDTGRTRALPRWNTARGEVTGRRPPDRSDDVAAMVSAELPTVRDEPGGPALLLLHVLSEVEQAWETSYHFGPLWTTLRVTCRVAPQRYARAGGFRGNRGDC